METDSGGELACGDGRWWTLVDACSSLQNRCAAAFAVVGGFDSHTPLPLNSSDSGALVVTLAGVCWKLAQPDLHPLAAPAEWALGNALLDETEQIMAAIGEQVDLTPVRTRAMGVSGPAQEEVARAALSRDAHWWFEPYPSQTSARIPGAVPHPYVASVLA